MKTLWRLGMPGVLKPVKVADDAAGPAAEAQRGEGAGVTPKVKTLWRLGMPGVLEPVTR